MNTLPPDALALLKEARTNQDFMFNHGDHLTGSGERTIDFTQYRFKLSDGQDMFINFSDASFTGFSIVAREPQEPDEDSDLFFEGDEPDPNK